MVENKDSGIKQSGWNLSESIIMLISTLMKEASYLYARGQLRQCFFKWKSIKFLVYNRFSEEERAKLKAMEKDIHPKSDYKKSSTFGEEFTYDRDKFAEYLEDYIEALTLLLRQYRLDIVDREVKDRLN